MASQESLILRNALVRERLNNLVNDIRNSGVDVPEPNITGRDKAVAQAQELEFFGDVLEIVLNKLNNTEPKELSKPKPAPKK